MTRIADKIESLLILASVYAVMLYYIGPSPLLLFDTNYEESYASWCVDRDLCALYGPPTVFLNFWQGGAWSYIKSTFKFFNLDLNIQHKIIMLLDAISILLIYIFSKVISKNIIAIFSIIVSLHLFFGSEVGLSSVHNSRLMFFPSTIFSISLLTFCINRQYIFFILSVISLSIVVNIHAATLPLLFTYIVAISFMENNKIKVALFSLLGITLTILFSPGVWSYQLYRRIIYYFIHPTDFTIYQYLILFGILIFFFILLLIRYVRKYVEKYLLQTVIIVAITMGLSIYLVTIKLYPDIGRNKYLTYLIPFIAVGSVIIINSLFAKLKGSILAKTKEAWYNVLVFIFLISSFNYLIPKPNIRNFLREPCKLNYSDVNSIMSYFLRQNIDYFQMIKHTKSPQQVELISAFTSILPIDSISKRSADTIVPPNTYTYYILKIKKIFKKEVENIGGVILREYGDYIVVSIKTKTIINWKNFEICRVDYNNKYECVRSSLDIEPIRPFSPIPVLNGLRIKDIGSVKYITIKLNMSINDNDMHFISNIEEYPGQCSPSEILFNNISIPSDGLIIDQKNLMNHSLLELRINPSSKTCLHHKVPPIVPFFIEAEYEKGASIYKFLRDKI